MPLRRTFHGIPPTLVESKNAESKNVEKRNNQNIEREKCQK
jgi:hypothetical protein